MILKLPGDFLFPCGKLEDNVFLAPCDLKTHQSLQVDGIHAFNSTHTQTLDLTVFASVYIMMCCTSDE